MARVTARMTFAISWYSYSNVSGSVFSVGGYSWSLHFNPTNAVGGLDLCLQLETKRARVSASLAVGLLDPSCTLPARHLMQTPQADLEYTDEYGSGVLVATVDGGMLHAAAAAGHQYTSSGLLFDCTLTFFPKPTPASDIMEQLARMYGAEDGSADVTYSVGGELFRAHKVILAMRSPVFKAQLYGGMTMDSQAQRINVEDMLPRVFEALLRYIYTDALPCTEEEEDDDGDVTEMLCHLLVAADRFGVQRLMILCESKLCDLLGVRNMARLLTFTVDRQCYRLKDACIEFMAAASPERMKEVMATEEYAQLRSTRTSVLIDALEKANMFQR